MKRTITILLVLTILLLSLSACSEGSRSASDVRTISLRIIDGAGTGSLTLAGDDVYTVSLSNADVFVGENKGSTEDLANGMVATIAYDGEITNDNPRQFSEVISITVTKSRSEMARDPSGDFYDLCSLYLKVLDTLWYTNKSMNEDVKYISVDLAEAPGSLTPQEKSAIAWAFASRHDAVPLELTIDELIETGYVNLSELRWKTGELFSIGSGTDISTVGSVSFTARKWRSGNDSVTFLGCTSDAPGKDPWLDFNIGYEDD